MCGDPVLDSHRPHRQVRSYVLRQGRLTASQQRALQSAWPQFGIDFQEQPLDLDAEFGRQAPRILEIGFGNGEALLRIAQQHPEMDYLGIEVHRPGVGHLLGLVERERVRNIRVICHDAVEVLRQQIPDQSLDRLQLFFPDPWHKTRHHKRRIVQPAFVQLVAQKLRPGAHFHMATDWEDYARHMLSTMETAPGFENTVGQDKFAPRPDYRPLTKFEQRGLRLGHGVWDLIYRRI